MGNEPELGPIDFVLLEFPDDARPTGAAARQLRELVDAGTISLYDIVALRKAADGTHETFDLSEFFWAGEDSFAYFAGARSGLLSDDDVAEAAAALRDNTIGIMLVFENAWASGFVGAARSSGGAMVATSRIPAQDLLDVLDELDNQ